MVDPCKVVILIIRINIQLIEDVTLIILIHIVESVQVEVGTEHNCIFDIVYELFRFMDILFFHNQFSGSSYRRNFIVTDSV